MSVKVFRINRREIITRLKSWASSLSNDPDVLSVVLFGSFAKNEETPASDADILILLKNSKERFDERIPHFLPSGIGICVDVFPYTVDEFKSLLRDKQGIVMDALKNGILLYGSNPETYLFQE